MAKLVESVYGNAMFSAAKEQGRLTVVRTQAEDILKVIDENPDYMRILTHPNLEKEDKQRLINEAFEGKADPILVGTLVTLIDRDHAAKISKTLKNFITLSLEEEGIGVAEVTSSFELSDDQKKAVEDKLLQTTKYDTMRMNYKVDKSLIGGLIIKLGDIMVDSSISTKLSTLKKSLERNI